MQQPERSEISIYRCHVRWCKIDFNLNNIIATLRLSISSKKNLPANVIKVSAAILNLVSFSLLFDRRDSAKPEKINISLFSGMAVAYLDKQTNRTAWGRTLFQALKQLVYKKNVKTKIWCSFPPYFCQNTLMLSDSRGLSKICILLKP